MNYSSINHKIKHREKANDKFYTPLELAIELIKLVPLKKGDTVLDSAKGDGAFYDHFPSYVTKDYCEIDLGKDFFEYKKKVDWIITNPPFSKIDNWLDHTFRIAKKGFAFVFGLHNLTPRRIEKCNKRNFYITKLHCFKVFEWFGITCFFVCEKDKSEENIITYNRKVWRLERSITLEDEMKTKRRKHFKTMDSFLDD
jgi:hypothetical protein